MPFSAPNPPRLDDSRTLWKSAVPPRRSHLVRSGGTCLFRGERGFLGGEELSDPRGDRSPLGFTERSGGPAVVSLGGGDRERVRDASPIEDVIRDYGVDLKPDGRNWKALCPFHREKSPSFKVDPDRSSFRCFGCGEGGDVFTFVEKMESVDFRGALGLLAERAGIELSGRRGPSVRPDERTEDRKISAWAAQWFRHRLQAPEGAAARSYMEGRGFRPETIARFEVGFAPGGWTGLADALRAERLDLDRAVRLGLLKRSSEGRVYDAFRARVVFPIRDTRGRVIGFGGRHLEGVEGAGPPGGDPPPKYINSPESDLFKKSQVLYGQYEGRDEIRGTRRLFLMEGYTDVMMAHQAGFPQAVATMGTALTEANVDRVARFADRVALVFDGDRAGVEAARKAVHLFAPRTIDNKVVLLGGGEDPAEMLRAPGGAEAFRDRIESGTEALEFALERCFAGEDPRSATGRERGARAFYEFVEKLPSEIGRGTALERLASRVSQRFERVQRDFADWKDPRRARQRGSNKEEEPRRGILPGEEDGILLAALVSDEHAGAVFRLVPPDRFADPLLGRLAGVLSVEGTGLDPVTIEDSALKAKLLSLRERLEEQGPESEGGMRLLIELLRRRLHGLAREGRSRMLEASADASELVRRSVELRRVGAELSARPPQHPEEVVEILDRFESGPMTEGRPEPQVG